MNPELPKMVAVLMAGGAGTRFWPWSRRDYPKQFLSLTGDRSLIQQTRDRLLGLVDVHSIFVCASRDQRELLTQQIPEASLILEPSARNTAPCLMLSVKSLFDRGYSDDTVMFTLPSDHFISRPDIFERTLRLAAREASEKKALVLLGIVPTKPHTGYGYIEASGTGAVRPVERFVEKPDLARATEFLASGRFFWNSGIFIWTLGSIRQAFEAYMPDAWRDLNRANDLDQVYPQMPSVPIDIAVLEKCSNRFVLPVEMGWSDIGSWDALHELLAQQSNQNLVISGELGAWESSGCLVRAPGKKVALIGVENLIVVEDGDNLLITVRKDDQKVRLAATRFDPPTR